MRCPTCKLDNDRVIDSRSSDDGVIEQMRDAGTVLGLGDGGAHYGVVCDLSLLSGWQTLNR